MRILHAIRSGAFAGVERHVATLAAAQARLGHDVAVVGGDLVEMRRAMAEGVPLYEARTTLAVAAGVQRLHHTFAPDVVHAHMTAAEIGAGIGLGLHATPLVATLHFARPRGANPVNATVARFAARRLRGQIAVSKYVAAHSDGDSTVIYPGVPLDATPPDPAERSSIVLVAQRLESEKSTDLAVAAFARSGLAAEGWRLDIAGDGAQRAPLRALVTDVGITEGVRFLGHRSDLPELMRRSGILLAPCQVEGVGLTVLEAMAVGLPVIAAGAGGHLETVGQARQAAFFAPGDAGEAAEELRRLAGDPKTRAAYGQELLTIQQERFTPAAQAEATMRFYEEVS